MNSLVKVFSNFKEFYSEINGATLTGAIDVIVVEQPDGEFQCSPFHVRFGKLGVLRSREKIVDIEINGEPVDIHMKLGESGEAFFVEECPEEDAGELPDNMATSPIPSNYFPSKYADDDTIEDENGEEKSKTASDYIQVPLPLPRRNSIDFSKEAEKEENVAKFENQVSDFSYRRYTDNTLERPKFSNKLNEYTTQRIRQEWAEHEIFQFDAIDKNKDWSNSIQTEEKLQRGSAEKNAEKAPSTEATTKEIPIPPHDANKRETDVAIGIETATPTPTMPAAVSSTIVMEQNSTSSIKEELKSKKKRRKKSQMKKKNAQRKSSSSSSLGSNTPVEGSNAENQMADDGGDTISVSISNNTNSSSNDEGGLKSADQPSLPMVTAMEDNESVKCQTSPITPITPATRIPDLDIHFFSDTEVTSSGGNGACGAGRGVGRPSTPIQSDSELEISLREKDADVELMSSSTLWKWGELPTQEHSDKPEDSAGQAAQAQAQRNSMLSNMFNFMKKNNKMRKQANDGGIYLSELNAEAMDPEMAAMYFPSTSLSKEVTPSPGTHMGEDDRESGNGTSLPHSPSSMEGQKSVDSDYEDGGKSMESKFSGFMALSTCGMSDGGVSDEEFERHIVKYEDVCENPHLFSSPNLIVRLDGKYYTWSVACPIVMTMLTFQKPLATFAIEQCRSNIKPEGCVSVDKPDGGEQNRSGSGPPGGPAAVQSKRSWWNWRRSQNAAAGQQSNASIVNAKTVKIESEKDGDQTAVATQTTRPNSPDVSENTLSKTDSTLNAENTSAMLENLEDLSQSSSKSLSKNGKNKSERYKKSLRLSSEAIKKLNLDEGINEIEFSVTTAYQGTTRCKCYLFRWKHNDKVVISDIDGTITKSDVLGHILPMVGKDWAQLGVAQLFSKIEQNGYKLLYLSARAIGQSRATREYLRSIQQGDVKLPVGPLLLNPTSLISAFHREVIERKPEQFKIACLSDIRDLFPNKDPFYAGYGNRINDVWAYRAVGIPIMRIFTINTKGELKHELTQTFQSSGYINQSLEIDEHFPCLETNQYETDTFEEDDDEDELKFSELSDGNSSEDEDVIYSDEYADDGIDIDEGDGLVIENKTDEHNLKKAKDTFAAKDLPSGQCSALNQHK